MIRLHRHIEILLLAHDCVIVPGFGGFVAHQIPSRYNDEERLFLPPMRALGFNPQLQLNDSLLTQSYIEAYDLSYPEALRTIDDEVRQLKQILSDEGEYYLTDLGRLSVNLDGNYEFEPCEAGILTPNVYGLDAYQFKRLKDRTPLADEAAVATLAPIESALEVDEKSEEKTPELIEIFNEEDDDSRALRIKMSWVRTAVAVAAAIAVFFLFATPVVNSDLGSQTMSQLHGTILYKLMPQDTNMVPAQPVKPEPEKVVAKADTKSEVKPEAKQEPKQPVAAKPQEAATEAPYCIVLASQVKLSNAEDYVNRLHQQGYTQAKVFVHNNIVRVICGEFTTPADAYNQLNRMTLKNDDFSEAWVYKKKV